MLKIKKSKLMTSIISNKWKKNKENLIWRNIIGPINLENHKMKKNKISEIKNGNNLKKKLQFKNYYIIMFLIEIISILLLSL
jgi:hypothetical protein